MNTFQNKLPFILSFIAGYVDTAGFIALGGIFTAHVTGNLVLAGASLSNPSFNYSLGHLLLIPVFIFGVAITSIVIQKLVEENRPSIKIMLMLQSLLLLLFSISTAKLRFTSASIISPENTILIGSIGVIAMAVQNTYMRMLLKEILPSTVMTGNLTLFSIEIAQYAKSKLNGLPYDLSLLKKVGNVLAGFLVGSFLGAICVLKLGLLCIFLPSVILLVTALFYVKKV